MGGSVEAGAGGQAIWELHRQLIAREGSLLATVARESGQFGDGLGGGGPALRAGLVSPVFEVVDNLLALLFAPIGRGENEGAGQEIEYWGSLHVVAIRGAACGRTAGKPDFRKQA